ncbi:MAG: hypothetical protein PHF84_06710 [bacterium]|nr:hypothetical protein [bacterium]
MIHIFILPLILAGELSAFTWKDGHVSLEGRDVNNRIGLYQEFRMNFEMMPNENVKVLFSAGDYVRRLEEADDIDDIRFLFWTADLIFVYKKDIYIGIGDRYLNYSPYTIRMEPWNDNIFRGLFVRYASDRYGLEFDGFLGLHAESTNRIKFNGEYLRTDIGFQNKYYINKIQTEIPTIWGAFSLTETWNGHFRTRLIYVRENYSQERPVTGFITYYFFNNHIFQTIFSYDWEKKISLEMQPALMIRNYSKYNGFGDYYGSGKHKLVMDYESSALVPSGEVKLSMNSLLPYPLLSGSFSAAYRYVDERYNPVHMDDGRLSEDRGEDFLDDILLGEKGVILNTEQPVLKDHFWGVEYREFVNILEQKRYFERRYFFRQVLNDRFSLLGMFFDKSGYLSDQGTLPDINGLIVRLEGPVLEDLNVQLWLVENTGNVMNKNEVFIKVLFSF